MKIIFLFLITFFIGPPSNIMNAQPTTENETHENWVKSGILSEINRVRSHHGANPLELRANISEDANKIAKMILADDKSKHVKNGSGSYIEPRTFRNFHRTIKNVTEQPTGYEARYGICRGIVEAPNILTITDNAEFNIVKLFYWRGRDLARNTTDPTVWRRYACFVQMIYKAVTHLGIGIERKPDRSLFAIVLLFSPKGNLTNLSPVITNVDVVTAYNNRPYPDMPQTTVIPGYVWPYFFED